MLRRPEVSGSWWDDATSLAERLLCDAIYERTRRRIALPAFNDGCRSYEPIGAVVRRAHEMAPAEAQRAALDP